MDSEDRFNQSLNLMIERGILQEDEAGLISVPESGKKRYKFFCKLIWPIIDSYWVSFVYISDLDSASMVFLSDLARNINEFAANLFKQNILTYFESIAIETINNAIALFRVSF